MTTPNTDNVKFIKSNIIGGGLSKEPLLVRFSDNIDIKECAGDFGPDYSGADDTVTDRIVLGRNPAYEVSITAENNIIDVGDKHPVYKGIYCDAVNVSPISPSAPRDMRVSISWSGPRVKKNGKNACQTSFDSYQIQQIKNFDKNGVPTRVFYIPGIYAPGVAGLTTIPSIPIPGTPFSTQGFSFAARIADIRIPRIMRGMRVITYEDCSDDPAGSISTGTFSQTGNVSHGGVDFPTESPISGLPLPYQPVYNKAPIWGYGPHELLYVGIRSENVSATPIYRREYNYLINEFLWDKFFAVYNDSRGLTPPDVPNLNASFLPPAGTQKINGVGVFDMIDNLDFSQIFGHLDVPTGRH